MGYLGEFLIESIVIREDYSKIHANKAVIL